MKVFILNQVFPEDKSKYPTLCAVREVVKSHVGNGMWHPVAPDEWYVFSRKVNEKHAIVYHVRYQEVWSR